MSSNAYTEIMAARRSVPKSRRDQIIATVSYQCSQCDIVAKFNVCVGVTDPLSESIDGLPAPTSISCIMCSGEMSQIGRFTAVVSTAEELPKLRLPSRRAAVDLARRDEVQAQVVLES